MSQDSNNDASNNIDDNFTNSFDSNFNSNESLDALDISVSESIDDEIINNYYSREYLHSVMMVTLLYIDERLKNGLTLPYFEDIDVEQWQEKIKALDIYITDEDEARELNLEARQKDYATNILSYPSDLPAAIIGLMPTLPLGELVICHAVMLCEAAEQNKEALQHISHLLIHGILHLLGFDHELGQAEQDEMESFEIEILAGLNIPNPYI